MDSSKISMLAETISRCFNALRHDSELGMCRVLGWPHIIRSKIKGLKVREAGEQLRAMDQNLFIKVYRAQSLNSGPLLA